MWEIRCDKIHATSTNVKELQQFLGLSGYYRNHINHRAKIPHTQTNQLKIDTPYQ